MTNFLRIVCGPSKTFLTNSIISNKMSKFGQNSLYVPSGLTEADKILVEKRITN